MDAVAPLEPGQPPSAADPGPQQHGGGEKGQQADRKGQSADGLPPTGAAGVPVVQPFDMWGHVSQPSSDAAAASSGSGAAAVGRGVQCGCGTGGGNALMFAGTCAAPSAGNALDMRCTLKGCGGGGRLADAHERCDVPEFVVGGCVQCVQFPVLLLVQFLQFAVQLLLRSFECCS